jgi:hypothetical protein
MHRQQAGDSAFKYISGFNYFQCLDPFGPETFGLIRNDFVSGSGQLLCRDTKLKFLLKILEKIYGGSKHHPDPK